MGNLDLLMTLQFIDIANYYAIEALERLGFYQPSQQKIDCVERAIKLALQCRDMKKNT